MAKTNEPQDPTGEEARRVQATAGRPVGAEVAPPLLPGDVASALAAQQPQAAAPVDTPGFDPNAASHPVAAEPLHYLEPYVDPEIAERQERIADLERQIDDEKREERRRLVDSEKALTIANLDEQEEALRAQLARVRGEVPTEE